MYTVQKFIQMSLVSLVMHSGTVVSRLYSRGWWGWMVRIFQEGTTFFGLLIRGRGRTFFCRWPVTKENFHHLGGGPGIFFCITPDKCFPKEGSKTYFIMFQGVQPLTKLCYKSNQFSRMQRGARLDLHPHGRKYQTLPYHGP